MLAVINERRREWHVTGRASSCFGSFGNGFTNSASPRRSLSIATGVRPSGRTKIGVWQKIDVVDIGNDGFDGRRGRLRTGETR